MSENEFPFSAAELEAADAPLLRVKLGGDGGPVAATAGRRVKATAARVWSVISDVQSYGGRIPMMDSVRVDDRFVTAHLRFGVSLFSAKFSFKAERALTEGERVELRYVEGEPHGLHIELEIAPASSPDHCLLFTTIGFDVFSLGWLAKYFLKHHPEIRYGIYPGAALALLDVMSRQAESRRG